MTPFSQRLVTVFFCLVAASHATAAVPPHIVLVMADDMGWGQTGYYNHPVLKTPNLDAMAANGLRFDRFYAGASNCSPTRATVMTGRTNDRTGVTNHGVPLRPQEFTIAQALQKAGYETAHFGKWHLNGMRGPGAPILKDDIRSPGMFGFDKWLSVTNFFDRDPILSRAGEFEEFRGDSSEIVIDEALKFISRNANQSKPSFTVVWFGTPHSPFVADRDDRSHFQELDDASANHYGELVAMDRSIGTLRQRLRELKIADDTLFWFCSDNGGLPRIKPETVGGLRGFKNTVYEGGLRVPAIIEWPNGIDTPRITTYPSSTLDIFPTLIDIVGAAPSPLPQDGISLKPLLSIDLKQRPQPIGVRHTGRMALIDNDYKLLSLPPAAAKKGKQSKADGPTFELYNVTKDHKETHNLLEELPAVAARMKAALAEWNESVERSVAGLDYPEGKVVPLDPGPRSWPELDEYSEYLDAWRDRPEFKRYIKP